MPLLLTLEAGLVLCINWLSKVSKNTTERPAMDQLIRNSSPHRLVPVEKSCSMSCTQLQSGFEVPMFILNLDCSCSIKVPQRPRMRFTMFSAKALEWSLTFDVEILVGKPSAC